MHIISRFSSLFLATLVLSPSSASAQSSTESPLYLVTFTHMERSFKGPTYCEEGQACAETERTDTYDEESDYPDYDDHMARLRYLLGLATSYGAKATIESERPFAAAMWAHEADRRFFKDEVLALGHGVGTHCDRGLDDPEITDVTSFKSALRKNRRMVSKLTGGSQNKGGSGAPSNLDWAVAARKAGFKYLSGIVAAHYLSMPLSARPSSAWTDSFIRSGAIFHLAAPLAAGATNDLGLANLLARVYPMLLADAEDFIADESGRLLVTGGTLGPLYSAAETVMTGSSNACTPSTCAMGRDDADAIVGLVQLIDAHRDRSRIAKVEIGLDMHQLDTANDDALNYFYQQMRTLEDEGVIRWATQREVWSASSD